jgi:hypothetical protein
MTSFLVNMAFDFILLPFILSIVSVILKIPHPLRPGWRGGICIELTVPFQFPQLLKSDLPDRAIQKNTVNKSVVPVDAKAVEVS